MIRNFLSGIFLFLVQLTAGFSYAQEPLSQATEHPEVQLRVVTEDSFPIQYLENGKVLGPSTELVKSVLDEAEIPYSIEVLPWARAYNVALTQPNTLIYSLARTPQREESFQWIGSVLRLNYYLVGMESLQLTSPVTLASLKKYKIGVIRGSATEQYLISQGFNNLYLVSKPSQSINMLKLGRIDLFPSNYSSFQLSCLHLKVDCQAIKPFYHLEQLSTSLYFALSKQTENEVVDKITKAYQTVMQRSAE
ncbi:MULTISPECIES: transporter substrate-binding domain-containing protein [Thalassotalea]|uniref:Transporter substrate-binding domain-containing protein n=1 Tax=Thalassotalea castellviae TaxID=3075612 RepID=A0ABU3A5A2_9GAMM|nr:transporter substrate-binding domain-containing protein [Thalassotalea sp. W431]MDT0605348.1 transporter substrate-binding domain-containing protein [Thalassotalea sp. W431]